MEKSVSVIYEDKNILVINKSAGMPVHPDATYKSGTLIQEILKTHPEIKNVGDEPELRPGIVHRLDKDTSGILLIAKNQPAFEYLKKQFAAAKGFGEPQQERKIKKTYIALVVGELKNKTGMIDLPIGRSKTPLRRLASKQARGTLREAITEYKILERFEDYTLVEAYPKTGRTHQISAHFKAIGHPLACDRLYAKKPKCPFGLNRHFLHASSLELTLPDGARTRLEADLAPDLQKVLEELRKAEKCGSN